jgi:hypothetical protein
MEVLARDCFVAYLNQRPQVVERLAVDQAAKRRFEFSKIPLETLKEYGFDLSGQMGTLLSRQQDFSDIYTIKSVFTALFREQKNLAAALEVKELRILNEQRHLIVHRRGIVDKAYVERTGSTQAIGSRLEMSPETLEKFLWGVRDVGGEILRTTWGAVAKGPEA